MATNLFLALTPVSDYLTCLLQARCGSIHLATAGTIDAETQPSQDAIRHCIPKKRILHERVTTSANILLQDKVLVVGRDGLVVARVRRLPLDARDEVLVKVHLPDVTRRHVDDGVVGQRLGVQVRQHVDVRRAAKVVAREDCLELHHAVVVGLLQATEEGRLPVGGVGRARTVVVGYDAAVDAGGVCLCDLGG